jgi:hypothetical protein
MNNLLIPSPRTWTFATSADLVDDDAVKTSIASVAANTTYTAADFNGAMLNGNAGLFKVGGKRTAPRVLSVTTGASGGSYNLATIVVTGKNELGEVITDSVTLTQTGGNETLFFAKGFVEITSIYIPAMVNTSGSFKFGVRDAGWSPKKPARQVRGGAAGAVLVGFGDGSGATDALPCAAGEHHDVMITRLYGSATTTAYPVTVYE